MIRAAVAGVCGRMGSGIASLLGRDGEISVVGATETPGHGCVGREASELGEWAEPGVVVRDDMALAAASADVIVDFTAPAATLAHAEYAAESGKSMVIGTTGFTDAQREELFGTLGGAVPCVFSPNMSVGINVLLELARTAALCLGDGYDAEIVEAHHRRKVDAPSGTALALAESVASARGRKLSDVARYERRGNTGPRKEGEIGVQTLRGGDVVGDHAVMFLGDGERIELSHRAASRENFSSGALRAVKWVAGKPPGIYSMRDVLGL